MDTKPNNSSLNDKFQLLYKIGINPSVKSHSQLASALGVSRQAVNKWVHGTETRLGNRIPPSRLNFVADIFDIPSHWLELPFEPFQLELAQRQHVILETEASLAITTPVKIFISMMPLTDHRAVAREQELNSLNRAFKSIDSNIVEIFGLGGIGKSTLVNTWLASIESIDYLGAQRVFAWSFAWQGTSGDTQSSADLFIESALEWYGDKDPTAGSLWSKVNRLVEIIRYHKTILILDGIETLLSPPGVNSGRVEDRSIALLIRELAAQMNGICIITSRIRLLEIELFYQSKIVTLRLQQLPEQSAISLLRGMGVTGRETVLANLVNRYEGHPLSLKLLGGYLTIIYPGTAVSFLDEINVRFDFDKAEPQNNVMRSYQDWFEGKPELSILYLLSLFDRPVSLEILRQVSASSGTRKLGLGSFDTSNWRLSLKGLSESGLVTMRNESSNSIIDCHPLVRSFFSNLFQANTRTDWLAGHEAMFYLLINQHLKPASTRAELEPLVQAIYHGCLAERYLEAFDIFKSRIKKGQVINSALHSHYLDLDCIAPFFERRWAIPRRELPADAQNFLLACATANLIYLGKMEVALEPASLYLEGFIAREEWVQAIISAAQITTSMIYLGRLTEAKEQLQKFSPMISSLGNAIASASEMCFRGYIHHLRGEDRVATELFEQAYRIYCQEEAPAESVFPIVHYFYSVYLIDTQQFDKALMQTQRVMTWREGNSWQTKVDLDTLRAVDNSCLGIAHSMNDNADLAKGYLNKAVAILRDVEDWMYLPIALNYRGLNHSACNDYERAIADFEESIKIGRSTGSKLTELRTHLNYCLLEIKRGRRERVQEEYDYAHRLLRDSEFKMRSSDFEIIENFLC